MIKSENSEASPINARETSANAKGMSISVICASRRPVGARRRPKDSKNIEKGAI